MKLVVVVMGLWLAGLVFAGCGSAKALGSVQIVGATFDVRQEGSGAAGSTTRFVIRPTAGRGEIASVQAWVGIESGEGSVPATASFDEADGDFDVDVKVPSPLPADSRLWITVESGDTIETASIAL